MASKLYTRAILDALIQFLQSDSGISGLGLVYLGYSRTLVAEPVYPSRPVADCPFLHIRPDLDELSPGPPHIASDMVYLSTWFYYRRQTPGDTVAHVARLMSDVEVLVKPFIYGWDPVELQPSGTYLLGAVPEQVDYLEELKHPFDDPRLRVSVARIRMRIRSRSQG